MKFMNKITLSVDIALIIFVTSMIIYAYWLVVSFTPDGSEMGGLQRASVLCYSVLMVVGCVVFAIVVFVTVHWFNRKDMR